MSSFITKRIKFQKLKHDEKSFNVVFSTVKRDLLITKGRKGEAMGSVLELSGSTSGLISQEKRESVICFLMVKLCKDCSGFFSVLFSSCFEYNLNLTYRSLSIRLPVV